MPLTEPNKRWILAVAYVLFIYSTLSVVGVPLRFLRAQGILRLSLLTLYVLCSSGLIICLIKTKTHEAWRYLLLLGVLIGALFIAKRVKIPEEQIHFFEYGLVGVFFAWALEFKRGLNPVVFLSALTLAGFAGWLDEIIQGHIPGRHYDINDIALNVVSAFLGLLIYSAFPSENRMRNSSIQQKSALRS